jgi:hypothetical protein
LGSSGVVRDCSRAEEPLQHQYLWAVFTAFTSIVPNSMLLTLLAFAQPLALHAMSKCCVAIDLVTLLAK